MNDRKKSKQRRGQRIEALEREGARLRAILHAILHHAGGEIRIPRKELGNFRLVAIESRWDKGDLLITVAAEEREGEEAKDDGQ